MVIQLIFMTAQHYIKKFDKTTCASTQTLICTVRVCMCSVCVSVCEDTTHIMITDHHRAESISQFMQTVVVHSSTTC